MGTVEPSREVTVAAVHGIGFGVYSPAEVRPSRPVPHPSRAEPSTDISMSP